MVSSEHASVAPRRQRGAALLVMLALVGIIAGLAVVWAIDTGATEGQRVQNTARAMGTIRDALIARAARDVNRPGSLPCPDFSGTSPNTADDGSPDQLAGVFCPNRVGRVPWRSLDLPDPRDSDGNRFWYALSPAYNDSQSAGALNSDTNGQLTVSGIEPANDVVAIIFAPGPPLPGQDRAANPNSVASWLDAENANGDLTFRSEAPSATFNDRVLAITRDMLMPSVEQRVARQARRCLLSFSASAGGRYPFAANMTDMTYADGVEVSSGPPPVYATTLYGRIPTTLNATNQALTGIPGTYNWLDDDPMLGPGKCFDPTTWWNSWRELLLYRVAPSYAPSAPGAGPCGVCLTVNSGAATATDVEFVVIVAGRTLHDTLHPTETPNQSQRATVKFNPVYYLESAPNPNVAHIVTFPGSGVFGKRPRAVVAGPLGGFNDRVECVSASQAAPCGAN